MDGRAGDGWAELGESGRESVDSQHSRRRAPVGTQKVDKRGNRRENRQDKGRDLSEGDRKCMERCTEWKVQNPEAVVEEKDLDLRVVE